MSTAADWNLCLCNFTPASWSASRDYEVYNLGNRQYVIWHKNTPEKRHRVEISLCQNAVIGAGRCIDYLGVYDGDLEPNEFPQEPPARKDHEGARLVGNRPIKIIMPPLED